MESSATTWQKQCVINDVDRIKVSRIPFIIPQVLDKILQLPLGSICQAKVKFRTEMEGTRSGCEFIQDKKGDN